ncbi:unnamed protein product [Pleuronectes platessa]|uniref:Uncharacterized protein n=1 Tax=Pleuronectes platessa TaxID=8262 RepID=A0A9N7YV30_PLEPL|nr:unnamed protein product [Pleuronectes platessa]
MCPSTGTKRNKDQKVQVTKVCSSTSESEGEEEPPAPWDDLCPPRDDLAPLTPHAPLTYLLFSCHTGNRTCVALMLRWAGLRREDALDGTCSGQILSLMFILSLAARPQEAEPVLNGFQKWRK